MPRFTRFQLLVHLGAYLPLIWLVRDLAFDRNNPIQAFTQHSGKSALILLSLSLACTPINTVFKFRPALKVRRALGVYAFLYAALHFSTFLFDYNFDPALLYEAIFEKRYALVGFAAFLILLPLALTSTQGWMKRLGKKWKQLHRLVYVAGILVIIHYIWLVKADIREPLIYGGIIAVLLLLRLPAVRRILAEAPAKSRPPTPARAPAEVEAE